MTAPVSMIEKAQMAWGETLPDWISELARLAAGHGLNACAERLGYSAAVVSQAIANKYPGDMKKLEGKVRGALMGETVTCPVLGEIGRDACLDWQAKPRAHTNAVRTRVYRACRGGCPHSRLPQRSRPC